MLEMREYSIFDKKALAFGTPFFLVNDQVAVRTFRDLVMNKETQVSLHPEDYVLYKVGRFNMVTGHNEDLEKIEILKGQDVLDMLAEKA